MDFKNALTRSLKNDKRTQIDPFLLHSRMSDLIENDYEAKKAADNFYRLNAKYNISKTILSSVRRKKAKKHTYKITPLPIPPDDAFVFYINRSGTLHLSAECPCLKDKGYFCRNIYKQIRDKQDNASKNKPSIAYQPNICRRCGNFSPVYAEKVIDKLIFFICTYFGISHPEKYIFHKYNYTHYF